MTPQSGQQLAEDLRFVREAVQSSRNVQYRSAAVPILWAGIIAVGFPLDDFCTNGALAWHWAVWYWTVAPIVGFLLSCWLGYRTDRNAGVSSDRAEAWRIGLHWSSIFLGAIAVGAIMATNHLDGLGVGESLSLLVTGLVYYLGGVHIDRRFLWPGLAAMAGSGAIGHLGPYQLTIIGAVIAVALVASALWTKEKESHAHATSQA